MLENKLSWAPGSTDTILAGGEPQELVPRLRRTNPNAQSQGYALRPTNPNALSQVSTEELLLELRRRMMPPPQTPRHLGRLGRPRPWWRLARRGLAAPPKISGGAIDLAVGGAAIVFGAGGDYCDYPPEPSGQRGSAGGLDLLAMAMAVASAG